MTTAVESVSGNRYPLSTVYELFPTVDNLLARSSRTLRVFALLILYGFARHPAEAERVLLSDMCAAGFVRTLWVACAGPPGQSFSIVVPSVPLSQVSRCVRTEANLKLLISGSK
jgi:hypothetical protein